MPLSKWTIEVVPGLAAKAIAHLQQRKLILIAGPDPVANVASAFQAGRQIERQQRDGVTFRRVPFVGPVD